MSAYQEAIDNVIENEKIIYGTRSQEWHCIGANDRDYNTKWAIPINEAKGLSEKQAILRSTGARIIGRQPFSNRELHRLSC